MVSDFAVTTSVTEEMLQEITKCIIESFHPLKIILFGSHVYGNPTPDSDIDLLVVMEDDDDDIPAQRSAKVTQICRPRYIAMDVLIQTPSEIEKRLAGFDPFLEEVFTKGRVLYDTSG